MPDIGHVKSVCPESRLIKVDKPFTNVYRLTPNCHIRDFPVIPFDYDVDEAGPSHFDTLLAYELQGVLVRQHVVVQEIRT
jgi:hypothetical protein